MDESEEIRQAEIIADTANDTISNTDVSGMHEHEDRAAYKTDRLKVNAIRNKGRSKAQNAPRNLSGRISEDEESGEGEEEEDEQEAEDDEDEDENEGDDEENEGEDDEENEGEDDEDDEDDEDNEGDDEENDEDEGDEEDASEDASSFQNDGGEDEKEDEPKATVIFDPVMTKGGFKFVPDYHDPDKLEVEDLADRIEDGLYADYIHKGSKKFRDILDVALLSRA